MTKSNVNPNYYKTAGRERQGEDIVQEIHKQKLAQERAARAEQQEDKQKFIPGAPPVGEKPGESIDDATIDGTKTVGQINESANSSSST